MGDKKITTITITLKIEGGAVTAQRAVESVLDDGLLQEAINGYEDEKGRKLLVLSAVSS